MNAIARMLMLTHSAFTRMSSDAEMDFVETKQFTDSCWASLFRTTVYTHSTHTHTHAHRFFSISSLFHFSDFYFPIFFSSSPAFSFETSEFWAIIFLSFASIPFPFPSPSQSLALFFSPCLYLSACLFLFDELYARIQVEAHNAQRAHTHIACIT